MSIKRTIDSARLLVDNKMYESALTLVLLAISASSRKQFSKAQIPHDNVAFKKFLLINLNQMIYNDGIVREEPIHGFEYTSSGKSATRTTHSLEEIVYEQYRCSLVHEGELPNDVFFGAFHTQEQASNFSFRQASWFLAYDDSQACIQVGFNNELIMDYRWLDILIKLVEQADINADLFGPRPPNPNLNEPRPINFSVTVSKE